MSDIIIKDGIGWKRQGSAMVTVDVGEMAAEIERLRADIADMRSVDQAGIPWALERDLRAEIERLRAAVMEWLPIETAPKDGTRVLCWSNPPIARPRVVIVHWHQPANPAFGGSWIVDGAGSSVNLTHWMPLPPPPAS